MKKELLEKAFKPYLKPFNLVFIFLVFGVILVLLMIFVQQKSPQKAPATKEVKKSQIEIQDEETVVTVNENGMVEFKTPQRVFYQKWDSSKVRSIFQLIEEKAKTSPPEQAGFADQADYTVSFSSGGESQTVDIERDEEGISEIFETIDDLAAGGGEPISDYFSPGSGQEEGSPPGTSDSPPGTSGGGAPSGSAGGKPSDCPFWILSMCLWPRLPPPTGSPPATPSPSPAPVSPPTQPVVPDCTLWDHLITGRTVISQTLCIKEE